MIIEPKIRGFICTTAHPTGCAANVQRQIEYVKAQGPIDGPKRVLVIGSSTGYGLATRITSAFACGAVTVGVFFEKPPTEKKTATAGWYNAAAFDKAAHDAGLYAKSFNADAFAHETREQVIKTIKEDLGQVDLVVYSIAAPVRVMPDTGELVRSTLKPMNESYTAKGINTRNDEIAETTVEPATPEEVASTVRVMGGEDWELWLNALGDAGVLAEGVKTTAYSYIGSDITWPIYWNGTIGEAKKDLDRAARAIAERLEPRGEAYVSILKSVISQASSAIPVLPLYISIVFKVMQEKGVDEGIIEQVYRLFDTKLYGKPETDEAGRLRVDDLELRKDVQTESKARWQRVNSDNLYELSDYAGYKREFLNLFGFDVDGVDYSKDVSPIVDFDVVDLTA